MILWTSQLIAIIFFCQPSTTNQRLSCQRCYALHIMDFHGMQEPDVSLVEKSEYSLHPLMHSPCMKDRPRKAISTYCHKSHLLCQFFIQYWPLLMPMGSRDYENPALILFRATLTRSLE